MFPVLLMENNSNISLGIVLSDEQVQHVRYIQYMLSCSLKENVSFEKTVCYLLLNGLDAKRLLPKIRNLLADIDSSEITRQLIKSSMCLEDYV